MIAYGAENVNHFIEGAEFNQQAAKFDRLLINAMTLQGRPALSHQTPSYPTAHRHRGGYWAGCGRSGRWWFGSKRDQAGIG